MAYKKASEKIKEGIAEYERMIEEKKKFLPIVEALGLDELLIEPESVWFSYYSGIMIQEVKFERAATIARKLLPFVKKFEKSFQSYSKKVILTGMYETTRITIESEPSDMCRIKTVTVKTWVPAHEEERTKYELEGNCNPLTATETEETL